MSTIKSVYLQHLNGTTPNATMDTNGNFTVGGTVSGASSNMFRNRIINGDMRIDQRSNGSSVSVSTDARAAASDRFVGAAVGGGVFTLQRVADAPTGFSYSLKATVTTNSTPASSGHYYQINQRVEGYNVADLGWGASGSKTATLSFWVKSSITGTYGISFLREAASSYRSYVSSYTINAANTWEYKTITVSGDTVFRTTDEYTNGSGVAISFQLGLSSLYQTSTLNQWQTGVYTSPTTMTQWISTNGATFNLTGVQFEVGTSATPFEFRSYGQELALCQRYFYKSNPNTIQGNGGFGGGMYTTTNASMSGYWPVTMRATPTVSRGSSNDSFYISNINGAASGTLQNLYPSVNGMWTEVNSLQTSTVGMPIFYNGQLSVSAEL